MKKFIVGVLFVALIACASYLFFIKDDKVAIFKGTKNNLSEETKTARIVANGDILYHDLLYMSAKKDDGSYDFNSYFEYVKPWIESADLAIGDFEGTISDKRPLAGYPIFNAPKEAAKSMKDVGYDVVDLAHNHILDTGIYGLENTKKTFNDLGLDTIGVFNNKEQKEKVLIKEVNGIKIALLAYSYGYNGLEASLTKDEKENHLATLDRESIKKDLEKAEKEADVTVVMPQMGVEYNLEPTDEQRQLYRDMISWGADVVLGGHPHVVEPSETIQKDGDKKFIIYSMGNFISNQISTRMKNLGVVNYKWTERGLLMDLTFEKSNGKTIIKDVKAHPTLTTVTPNGKHSKEGYALNNYKVLILDDFIAGGKYRDKLDNKMQEKVDTVYKEMNELVNLKW